jgi:hypothetical protein
MTPMFGPPSFSKLVVLLLIVAVVWGFFTVVGRVQHARKEEEKRAMRAERARAKTVKVEDMVQCRSCGAYHAASVPHRCERAAGRG